MVFRLAGGSNRKIKIFPYEFAEVDLSKYIEIPLIKRDKLGINVTFRFFLSNDPGECVDQNHSYAFHRMFIIKPIYSDSMKLQQGQSKLSLFRFVRQVDPMEQFEIYVPIFRCYSEYPESMPPPQGRMGIKELYGENNISIESDNSYFSSLFSGDSHSININFEFGPIKKINLICKGRENVVTFRTKFNYKLSEFDNCIFWLRNLLIY